MDVIHSRAVMLINGLSRRYNHKWQRMVQDAISTVILCAWLGGLSSESTPGEVGRLLTLEDIGALFGGLLPLARLNSDASTC